MVTPLPAPRVSCIVIFLDGAEFIDEAIRSVVGQEGDVDWELLLVDDGSSDESTAIAHRWASQDARIRYLEHDGHENRGMSASRNLGLAHARGEYVAFLDCDDVWSPQKLAVQVPILDENPELDATYGPTLWWYSWTGERADRLRDELGPVGVPPGTVCRPPELLRVYRRSEGAVVPAICALLIRRRSLEAVGGFEDSFRGSYEDQILYAKMGAHMTVLVTGDCLGRYRQHPRSACAVGIADRSYHPDLLSSTEARYLDWLEDYLEEIGLRGSDIWDDLQRTLVAYREKPSIALVQNVRWRRSAVARLKMCVKQVVPEPIFEWLKHRLRGVVDLGDIRRVEPINDTIVGTPVEDVLAQRFFTEHRASLTGRVLVVGSERWLEHGAGVAIRHLESVEAPLPSTFAPEVPGSAWARRFDCIVSPSALQSAMDPLQDLRRMYAALAPGGVLLLTVPGLVQRHERDRARARWGFACETIEQLAVEVFGHDRVRCRAEGNALLAVAALHGLPAESLSEQEMRYTDPTIPVLVAMRAERGADR